LKGWETKSYQKYPGKKTVAAAHQAGQHQSYPKNISVVEKGEDKKVQVTE